MNILHLLSQNHLTGAEVYAATLAQAQIRDRDQVYQVSNGFFYDTPAIKVECEVETPSKIQFLKNILWLRKFIRKQNIHVVHSHSRAAAKLAYWATLGSRTGFLSTIHGIQHSSISKKLFNQYGQFLIAVCQNLKSHLLTDFSYREELIKVLPNPISRASYYRVEKSRVSEIKKIAIIGRSTGPKKERTEQVLKALFSEPLKNLKFEVSLVGGSLKDLDVSTSIRSRVRELQPKGLNSEHYSEYDLVIGSGRVCMESLISGINSIAFGEACYFGLVTLKNFSEALTSNFGDIHPDSKFPVIKETQFIEDVKTALTSVNSETSALSLLAEKEFSLELISAKVKRLYESAYFLKNYSKWIPVLMYHKTPDREIKSQHKIFVTRDNFEKHLKFFSNKGFTTLTFSELSAFRKTEKNFSEFPKKPLILTFDDGYRDNLSNASPLLKKYGFKSQLFLLANPDISSNNWDAASGSEPTHEIISGAERKLWLESQFEIGSHGFSHKKITELNAKEAEFELQQSKKSLETEFGHKVNVYAFTYGITNKNSENLAAEAGYDYAVNTDSGGLLLEEAPYSIFRVNIFPNESSWSLFKKTSSWYRKYYYLKRKK